MEDRFPSDSLRSMIAEGEVMKGAMLNQYAVGQEIAFSTGPKAFRQDTGRIIKLHRSGSCGTAEIRTHGAVGLPSRLTRSLRFVSKLGE